jgi:DNA/RNA endonuclease G (NUC1)
MVIKSLSELQALACKSNHILPDNIKRVTTSTRVIAVLIPNSQSCSEKEWGDYMVSVDKIEALTGYDFLSNVSVDIQKIIEAILKLAFLL